MGRDGDVGGGDEEAPCHAEMHDPLQGRFVAGQVEDDVLADTMDEVDARSGEGLGHRIGRGLEGLLVAAEPDRLDAFAADAFIDAVGDGFDFR